MNKPSKCKNCQWYGKPYWSIINPCDSCSNENDYKTIIQIDGVPVIKEIPIVKFEMDYKKSWEKAVSKIYDLQEENERLNNIITRIDSFVNRTIEVIEQQPSGNDEWILERLNGIKYLAELKEGR